MEIVKELFEQYYITEDRSREETAELFGIKPYEVSNYAKLFNLKKPTVKQKLEQLKAKYPLTALKEVYDRLGHSGTLTELGLKSGELDSLVKEYRIGKRGKQARFEATVDVEELKRYYIEENHSLEETTEHFNCTGTQLRQLLGRLGIQKDKKMVAAVARKTFQEKYGVANANHIPGIEEKKRQAIRSKYGVDCIFQLDSVRANNAKAIATPEVRQKIAESRAEHQDEITEKIRATLTERYGGMGSGSEIIRKKVEDTTEARYGDKNIRKTDWYRQHYKDVCLERYGEEHVMRVPEIKERAVKTNQERYGVNYFVLSDKYKHSPLNSSNSKPNLAFAQLLADNGIEFEREFPIANRSYDFKVGNILIEINPTATHNSTWEIKEGKVKESNYPLEKSKLAWENGYECVHVWDSDNWLDILEIIKDPDITSLKDSNRITVNLDKYSGRKYKEGGSYELIGSTEPALIDNSSVYSCGTLIFKKK